MVFLLRVEVVAFGAALFPGSSTLLGCSGPVVRAQ